MSEIPFGTCHCGCGQKTRLIVDNDASRGLVKGQPRKFLRGHIAKGTIIRATPEARFWAMVNKTESCWEWTGYIKPTRLGDYGRHYVSPRKFVAAHRFAYELLVGPIPEGLQLDHLCRNRWCVNPAHLEPVTHRENVRRGAKGSMVTHCPQGHEYDAENTYIKPNGCRYCRACGAASARRRRQRAKEQAS